MKKITVLLFFLLGLTSGIVSQTAEDALRYSRVFYSGTSRFNGLSGAFGAVGADFSTVSVNPAGLGLYQASELTFTFAPVYARTTSVYNGTSSTGDRTSFGLGNFGFIFSVKPSMTGNTGKIRALNFGFGFNRQNDFNNQISITGVNNENSMMQSYVNELNNKGIPPNSVEDTYPFDIGLAYGTNLVFYDTLDRIYKCDAQYGGIVQDKLITSYGSLNELDFSFGANFNDKLYFGLTVGVPMLRYYEYSTYQEIRLYDTVKNFLSLVYDYNLQTRGTGVNVKFGLIYRPAGWVRIGAAIHTPTWYTSMHDEWFSSMQSSFTTTAWNAIRYSPMGNYDYRLTTPFRAMGSLAFIIGTQGLISADYEYVNYSQARFNSTYDNYADINSEISSSYRSWGNLRFGTEWRLGLFRLRGGFAYFSNPYSNGSNNSEKFQASGGFGFRSKHFFADATYVWTKMKQDYYLYNPEMVNPSQNTMYTHTVLTTVGIRF